MNKKQIQELLEISDIKHSLPVGWSLEWGDNGPPIILDADGNCVCTLSTGNLKEVRYSTNLVIANAKRLLMGNG